MKSKNEQKDRLQTSACVSLLVSHESTKQPQPRLTSQFGMGYGAFEVVWTFVEECLFDRLILIIDYWSINGQNNLFNLNERWDEMRNHSIIEYKMQNNACDRQKDSRNKWRNNTTTLMNKWINEVNLIIIKSRQAKKLISFYYL